MNLKISVVIPSYKFKNSLREVLKATDNQTFCPKEIIVVDSSPDNEVYLMIKTFKSKIPILYHKVEKAFPGEARNIGVSYASYEWIAFLDSKTVPTKNWLKYSTNIIQEKNFQVVFGLTKYNATSHNQKLIVASTFGMIGHETTPGTIISKNNFINSKGFIKGVRTADDLEWRQRLRQLNYNCYTPEIVNLTYSEIPSKMSLMINRYYIYSFHTAKVNIQKNMKELYLSIFLIFSIILIPKWNYYVGWESSYLYIPNITKIYFFCICLLLLINILLNRFFFKIKKTIISNILKIIILLMSIYLIYNWNKVIANWVEEAVWYIPHITKVYLLILITFSFLYRGLFLPITRKVKLSFLIPFNWIVVGFFGLILDLIKAPGYVFGAIYLPLIKIKKILLEYKKGLIKYIL